jgi:large conductance mechanosensitive channel
MRLWAEFKEFMAGGNVLGLAVAVVIGTAFGFVVTSFTNDVLMQLIAAIGAKPSFENLAFNVRGAPIRYGSFLNACVSFVIVAGAMFAVVKAYSKLARTQLKRAESETDLLREIRDELRSQRPART